MSRLSILALGPLQIMLGDRPASGFESDKARALLTYLAVETGRIQPRETLAGLLWPGYAEESARQSLSQALSNVRHVIGDRDPAQTMPFLEVSRQTVQLNLAADLWLDVGRFAALAGPRASTPDPTQLLPRLEAAMALYRGSFLEGFSLHDSPEFEAWALNRREHLHRLAQETLARLIEGCAEQGDLGRALNFAWRLLDTDPLNEEAHRHVMRLLALSGQRSAALSAYAACCAALKQELHVQPEAQTTALYEQIRSGTLKTQPPSPTAAPAAPAPAPAPRANLPAQLIPLIGREGELTTLKALLADPDCRLLTLTGPGGIGKTRLGLEAAARAAPTFADGVTLVLLAPLESPQTFPAALAQALGVPLQQQSGSPEQQMRDYLASRTLLLVLDNAEHLARRLPQEETPAFAGMVAGLLEAAPGLKVLVTSRVALNVLGERLFLVQELAYPRESDFQPAALQQLPSVQLFVQAAQARRPAFALTSKNALSVGAICRQLEGVPLALLLCAAWIDTMSAADIAAELARGGNELLAADWANLPPQQRSMQAVFDRSWRLLTEREQAIFAALSVFRSPFAQAAAHEVAGATPRDLRDLVGASLLQREPTGRYTMHRLLHEYAAARLERDPDAARAARDRHGTYFMQRLETWWPDLKGARQTEALAEIDAEISDAEAAWDRMLEIGDLTRAIDSSHTLQTYFQHRYLPEKACRCWRLAVSKLEALASRQGCVEADRLLSLSLVLAHLSVWSYYAGIPEPLTLLERSLALLDDPALAGRDLRLQRAMILWAVANSTQDPDAARQVLEQCLALARSCGDRWLEGQLTWHLGVVAYFLQHDLRLARQRAAESLSIARSRADVHNIVRALNLLSSTTWSLGDVAQGLRLAEQSLEAGRSGNQGAGDRLSLVALSEVLTEALGQYQAAIALLEECRELQHSDLVRRSVDADLAYCEILMGNYGRAQDRIDHLADCDSPDIWRLKGHVALGLGHAQEAEDQLLRWVAHLRSVIAWRMLAIQLPRLSYALWTQGKLAEAEATINETLQASVPSGYQLASAHALVGFALLCVSRGEIERALSLFAAAAATYPIFETSKWIHDVAGRHIEAAAAALPPEVVVAARERGRALDLQATAAEVLASLESSRAAPENESVADGVDMGP